MVALARVKAALDATRDRAGRALSAARGRFPAFDHLVRAYQRYDGCRGDRLAGAVTFFGFLSFFPLLALAFAVTGYVVVIYPQARQQLLAGIESALPGIAGRLDIATLADARAGAGVIGLVGLLIAGIGWVDALRESLHEIWLRDPTGGGNVVVKKLTAVALLIALGGCLLASVAVSSLATSATRLVVGAAGLAGSAFAAWVVTILAVAVVLAFDTLVFLVLFSRLSGAGAPWRTLVRGAFFGAVGFEILKLIGTEYIPRVASNPVYGAFGLMVALLVWINLVSRFTLFAAAWTATRTLTAEGSSGAPDGEFSATARTAEWRSP